jgi:hypothetical protein
LVVKKGKETTVYKEYEARGKIRGQGEERREVREEQMRGGQVLGTVIESVALLMQCLPTAVSWHGLVHCTETRPGRRA